MNVNKKDRENLNATMQLTNSGNGMVHPSFINAGNASSKSQGPTHHPPRGGSQLAQPTASLIGDPQGTTYQRRSSIEAISGQLNNGVVGSVVNINVGQRDAYVHHQRVNSTSAQDNHPVGPQQIRTKAQYDEWIKL
jgi:hypothetical protein